MKNKPTVTFETKCYEQDWEFLLTTPLLKQMISDCNYPFDNRVLYINNVSNRNKVELYAKKAVKEGIIDNYFFAEDYIDEALKFFNIKKDSFKGGYPYSISELVGIYLCNTDYLLHFSGDTSIRQSKLPWIDRVIKSMEKNNKILVANPAWTRYFSLIRGETLFEDKDYFYGEGFSDQCYLIKISNFKKRIYNEKNESCNYLYPLHGGELFEKRISAYLRNHSLLRITIKNIFYSHMNFPKGRLKNIELKRLSTGRKGRFLRDYYGDIRKILFNRIRKLRHKYRLN